MEGSVGQIRQCEERSDKELEETIVEVNTPTNGNINNNVIDYEPKPGTHNGKVDHQNNKPQNKTKIRKYNENKTKEKTRI